MRFLQDWPENTLVEENGELRPANLAEAKSTSWKPIRHVQEFTYAGVKKAWLDKTVRNKANAWGKKPILEEKKEASETIGDEPEIDKKGAADASEDDTLKAFNESSDSSSSGSEDDSSSSDDSSDEPPSDGDSSGSDDPKTVEGDDKETNEPTKTD